MKRLHTTVFLSMISVLTFGQSDINDRKIEFRDGTEWNYYISNNIKIASNSIVQRDYGKWHKVNILISNNSDQIIEIDPTKDIYAYSTDKDNKSTTLEVWSSEQYLIKVKRAQNWAMALNAAAEGFNAGSAGYSNTSSYSYNNGYTYTNNYNSSQAYQAQVLSQMRVENLSNKMFDERNIKQMGYLKKNTIHPGESIQGYINIKFISGEKLFLTLIVANTNYKFDWNFSKK